MRKEALPRLDTRPEIHKALLPYCRLRPGDVWTDPRGLHRVGVFDAAEPVGVTRFMAGATAALAVHDPPYNISVGGRNTDRLFRLSVGGYMDFSRSWVGGALSALAADAHFYVWLGADQNEGFQPLPEFMLMMREFPEFRSRSLITLRNQRGYGTRQNWMAVRQELLYYVRGNPFFQVVYTDIPKVLKGYYKTVGGRKTENLERSLSDTIRPGNVWLDIQQVFYRMEENVPGAYAQKPLKAVERVLISSSRPGDIVTDFFSHAGTTLIAAERLGRRCFTFDIDPVFAEITIRRLERYRETGKTGWQTENPFPESPLPVIEATPSSSPTPSRQPSPPSQGTLF
jgi:site-specific DNA-methyltransferase (adenine-specific)